MGSQFEGLIFPNPDEIKDIETARQFLNELLQTLDALLRRFKTDYSFTDRGDASSVDFAVGDLTTDGNWNDLDISSIIPNEAKAVLLSLKVQDNAAGSQVLFRVKGNSNAYNISGIITQVSGVDIIQDLICPCDTDRTLQYKASNLTFDTIDITVKGWWK